MLDKVNISFHFDDSDIDNDAQEGDKTDLPNESSKEDNASEYSLSQETENYIEGDDEAPEIEGSTYSSWWKMRSQSKSGMCGILLWNVHSYVMLKIAYKKR